MERPGDGHRSDANVPVARIVLIAEETLEGFHRCVDAVARERRYPAFLQVPPFESSRALVQENNANGVPQFVALRGDEVVGWCDTCPLEREGFTDCGSLGMGVRSEYRRRGIGARLLERTIGAAERLGLERVELEVFASNLPATRMFEKAGLVVEGVKR